MLNQHGSHEMLNSPGEISDAERMLRLPSVLNLTALSRASIYAGVKAGTFPAPVKLSVRAVAWRQADLSRWLASRTAAVAR